MEYTNLNDNQNRTATINNINQTGSIEHIERSKKINNALHLKLAENRKSKMNYCHQGIDYQHGSRIEDDSENDRINMRISDFYIKDSHMLIDEDERKKMTYIVTETRAELTNDTQLPTYLIKAVVYLDCIIRSLIEMTKYKIKTQEDIGLIEAAYDLHYLMQHFQEIVEAVKGIMEEECRNNPNHMNLFLQQRFTLLAAKLKMYIYTEPETDRVKIRPNYMEPSVLTNLFDTVARDLKPIFAKMNLHITKDKNRSSNEIQQINEQSHLNQYNQDAKRETNIRKVMLFKTEEEREQFIENEDKPSFFERMHISMRNLFRYSIMPYIRSYSLIAILVMFIMFI